MNENRSLTSQGIWVGLCILLLVLLLAVTGVFAVREVRRTGETDRRMRSVWNQYEESEDGRLRLMDDVHKLKQRVAELEAENQELKDRLELAD
jgi:hypothetical protein